MNHPAMYQHATKKYIFEILQDKYEQHEQIITRLTHYLATEQDVRDFASMFAAAFEKGYVRAANDYRQKLMELGYNVTQTTAEGPKVDR